MKINASIVSFITAAAAIKNSSAFSPAFSSKSLRNTAFASSQRLDTGSRRLSSNLIPRGNMNSELAMSYSVGIVGATGAVGKEIVSCLENRDFAVSSLRIFGSERSAGSKVSSKFGEVTVELFDVDLARECDVVFLAVSGDFSLEHAENIAAGDDGAVVIDNSVSPNSFIYFIRKIISKKNISLYLI